MRRSIHPRGVLPLGWMLLLADPAFAQKKVDQPLRIGVSWDAEAELGFALAGIDSTPQRFFIRARAGILSAEEPFFFTAGATFEGSGPVGIAGGFQIGVSHLWTGLWGTLGLAVDERSDAFFHLSAGYSLIGIEWHRRMTGDPKPLDDRDVYLLKLRLPIGIFVFAY